MSEFEITDSEKEAAIKQAKSDQKKLKAFILDNEEKKHCQNIAVFGLSYLSSLGWKAQQIHAFISRIDVRTEITQLNAQFVDRASIQERTQFFAQMKVNMMVPHALTLLTRALMGTVIDANGNISKRPPERVQMDAALEVLNRANIQGVKFKGPDKLASLTLDIFGNEDPKKKLSAPAREKLRKMVRDLKAGMKAEDTIEAKKAEEATQVTGAVDGTETLSAPSDEALDDE